MPYRCRLLVTGVDALRLPSGNDTAFGQKPVGLRASLSAINLILLVLPDKSRNKKRKQGPKMINISKLRQPKPVVSILFITFVSAINR